MKKQGFTLLEILLVIGIIAILAAVVIIAINPGRQLAQARNAQRWSNVNSILNAVHQYAVDHSGNLPGAITTTETEICRTGGSCDALVDLSVLTLTETYLVSVPLDPSCSGNSCGNGSGYRIFKSVNGRITVTAPNAELSQTVSVTR